jgi:parallel beta-helix repeat protein
MLNALLLFVLGLLGQPPALTPHDAPQLPTLTLTSDNTRIDRSCRVEIPAGTVVADSAGDGVIQVVADGITVEFARGAILRGAPPSTPADTMAGVGIRVDGRTGVTIRGGVVSGFKVGLHATACPQLTVERTRFDDNFRHHLKSTPQAEDQSDWLWPHKNDDHQWRTTYGGAACLEDCAGATVRGITVRRGQNGLILDRVTASRIYDNDLSFLSGWGLAMWRSGGNLISRNAIDFCVRGYSHGVYNRGQDSAGILMFEQCSGNVIIENSVTHGGDGVFGFAGHEAIGETPPPAPEFGYDRRGCNDNLFVGNDLSYAPAHGLEMTFSFGNRIVNNRFARNAICGIWGGYSQGMLIAENTFEANGEMGYGLERGGVNIEHGSNHVILGNTFAGDKCGVHLWWADSPMLKKPWGQANERGVSDNVISGNTFKDLPLVLHLRDLSPGKDKIRGIMFASNRLENCAKTSEVTEGVNVTTEGEEPMYVLPQVEAVGDSRPCGARSSLAGRENIVMTQWGPWDHASPLVRRIASDAEGDLYAVLGARNVELPGSLSGVVIQRLEPRPGEGARFSVRGEGGPSLAPYELTVAADGERHTVRGIAMNATWQVAVFPWPADPREQLEAWRAGARPGSAVNLTWSGPLSLSLGQRGPQGISAWKQSRETLPGPSRYGLIARTELRIPKGSWRVVTRSDDGVRVLLAAAGQKPRTILENWTWHAPTRDAGEFRQEESGIAEITVEYFQIDGFAVLELALEPVK